ncbi:MULTISPECIES: AI-2E family transporter [unclassified Micromonospora]|uniref:AI-2E family transporter n=1 Tax=unclassified Micromonospora TaxID=2617518 RepID=UPI0015914451|nr:MULTISPECIES: AI-2E family transporter [unclassified Micromonospora]QKW15044.1 AI-2E family transporter [Verrucosispora sp. NA02020]
MSRFEQLRHRLRRAYDGGRESVRAARDRDRTRQADRAEEFARPIPEPRAGNDGEDGHPSTISRDDAGVPHSLRIAAAWSWRIIVIGIVGWAMLRFMGTIRVVIVPLLVALLLSALLAPAVGWLLRARFPRSLATAVVLIGGLAAVVGTLTMVVSEFVTGLPDLSRNAADGIGQIQNWLRDGPLNLSDGTLNQYIQAGQNWINENTQALTTGALSTAGTVVEIFTGALLVLFAMFFFLRDGQRIWRFIVGMFPAPARWRLDDAGRASWQTLVAYVRATVLVAFIDAVGIGIALVLFDVPFAFALAALVFLGAFIPIVGATLSGAVAVLVALVDGGWVTALFILGAVIVVQQVEGNVLQPWIMGKAVALHPLPVVLAVTAGVVLDGIFGALIAVPLIAVLNTAVRRLARRLPPAEQPPPPEAVVVKATTP